MTTKIWIASSLLFFSMQVQALEKACSPVLNPFVCKDKTGQKISRCAVSKTSYSLQELGDTFTCEPVMQVSTDAKKIFVALAEKPEFSLLQKFKARCDYSSPMNFETDPDILASVKSIYTLGNPLAVRALLFAEKNCANVTNHELILSWLGNEILIHQASSVIKAFYDEGKIEHLNEIAKMENIEWRKFRCKTKTCKLQRSTYFESKLAAVKKAQIPKEMEPVRQEILASLRMVSDVSKTAFLNLAAQPGPDSLENFKNACTDTSPLDFLDDKDLHQTAMDGSKVGNVFVIRALIHADTHCADIANRKRILSWLGNEILIQHPAKFIEALSFEDQKHELYDIAEMENDYWKENKCLGDPCATSRREYFASKRNALVNAKIQPKNEPYRRQLLKYLVSDLVN